MGGWGAHGRVPGWPYTILPNKSHQKFILLLTFVCSLTHSLATTAHHPSPYSLPTPRPFTLQLLLLLLLQPSAVVLLLTLFFSSDGWVFFKGIFILVVCSSSLIVVRAVLFFLQLFTSCFLRSRFFLIIRSLSHCSCHGLYPRLTVSDKRVPPFLVASRTNESAVWRPTLELNNANAFFALNRFVLFGLLGRGRTNTILFELLFFLYLYVVAVRMTSGC